MHSPQLIDFLISFDSFSETYYLDPGGIPTIGYGHKIKKGEENLLKVRISKEEAKSMFAKDLQEFERDLNKSLKNYEVNQQQYDALLSMFFNCGPTGAKSTRIWQDFLAGKVTLESFLNSAIRDAKKVVRLGLQRRRYDEWEIWDQGDYVRNENRNIN